MSKAKIKSGSAAAESPSFVARLVADERLARRIADLLSECLDAAETACATFELPDGRWQIDIHFRQRSQEPGLRTLIVDDPYDVGTEMLEVSGTLDERVAQLVAALGA